MTTKYLTGAYPGGYTLRAAYTGLDVEATASVGGTGVDVASFATIQNDGVINATIARYNGVTLHAGGMVTNGSATDTTALIEGDSGIYCGRGQSLILANFGTISGKVRYGVVLYGGSVTNGSATDTTALIEGNTFQGVWGGGPSSDTITNFGTITSVSRDGIILLAGAIVTNGSATDTKALIEGSTGIYRNLNDNSSVAITNFGTIAGTGGTALQFGHPGGMLQVEAGCVFNGAVLGGGGTLDLASGVGTISGLAGGDVTVSGSMATTAFTNFGTLGISSGATFTLAGSSTIGPTGTNVLNIDGSLVIAGALTIGATATLNDTGVIDQTGTILLRPDAIAPRLIVANGATYKLDGDVGVARRESSNPMILIDGLFIKSAGTGVSSVGVMVSNVGVIEVATGTLSFIGGVQGTGLMKIDAGTTLRFAKPVANTLTASFNGAGGTLALNNAAAFAATIAGFATGETIDLINTAATSAVLNGSDQLVITNGTTAVATLQLTGTYTGATFAAASDGHGGTAITVSGGAAALPAPASAHVLVAAMAAMTGGAGAAHEPPPRLEAVWRPLLASPRTALA